MVALAYDGLCTFEFGVAVEIFGLERPEMGAQLVPLPRRRHRARAAARRGGIRVETDGGLSLIERGRHHRRAGMARRRRARARRG